MAKQGQGSSPFRLSIQLEGHSADVRSVAAASASGDSLAPLLLSGSRDGTARVWGRPSGSKSKRDLSCWHTLEGQSGFVNCTAWLRDSQTGEQIALAGGQDHMINAYHVAPVAPAEGGVLTPDYTLLGHEDNVCALHVHQGRDKGGDYIVSGSWDKTARVWKNWECVAVLAGHSQAVWAVLAIDDDRVLTASADKVIRQYSISDAIKNGDKSKPTATYAGNTDAVRGLLRLDADTFASCGNDGNISLYKLAPAATSTPIQPIQVLSGHTSFVYSLSLLESGEIASSGEDRSVRIWRAGSLVQTITVPAISVWSVASMQNGDVACASSDGFVRVFSRTPQRFADDDIIQAYDAAVSSQALNKAQVGDVQKESLPGTEALAAAGREGQVKMVRNGDLVEAHQYSAAAGRWEKIGEVVGGVGSSQKKLFEGKEYDYVFDVDIADGVPALKLPYNATENPYVAAQRFLERNELPMNHLDQVVRFIEQNTGGVSLGGTEQFRDPYTGASSYRPGGASSIPSADTAASAPAPATTTTGSDGPSILPHTNALTFKQFNEQGAKSKIAELNGQLPPSTAMSAEESAAINSLLSSLAQAGQPVDNRQLDVLESLIGRWPLTHRFPLLDVYRVASVSVAQERRGAALNFALEAAQWNTAWPAAAEEAKIRSTLSLLALRAASNALSDASIETVTSNAIGLLEQGKANLSSLPKPARVAFATLLLNLSILLVKLNSSHAIAQPLLRLIAHALETENNVAQAADRDGEAIYRASMAFGNLIVGKSAGSLGVVDVHTAQNALKQAVGRVEEARLSALWLEVQRHSSVSM